MSLNAKDVADLIRNGNVIPIIGSDLLNAFPNNNSGDFLTNLIIKHTGDKTLQEKYNYSYWREHPLVSFLPSGHKTQAKSYYIYLLRDKYKFADNSKCAARADARASG